MELVGKMGWLEKIGEGKICVLFSGGGGTLKKDNEGHVVMLGVELTSFKETFQFKISTRLIM